jgi:endoglucanase
MPTRIRTQRRSLDPSGPPPVFVITSDRGFGVVEVATDPMLFDGSLASRRTPATYFSSEGSGLIPLPAGRSTFYTLDLAAFRAIYQARTTPGVYYRAVGLDAPAGPRDATAPLFLPTAVARRPPTPAPRGISASLLWLRVDGNRIVDENGDPVVLRGVVRSGLEYTAPGTLDPTGVARTSARAAAGITPAEAAEIANHWGANVVRVPINQEWALTRAGYLDDLDRTIALYAANGAYTMLALSRLDARRAFGFDAASGRPSMNPPLPEENTLALWRQLAERYRRQPAVLYDIFNEPHLPLASDTDFLFQRPAGGETDAPWVAMWHEWVRRIEQVIHHQNQLALLFVSGVAWGLDLRSFPVRLANGSPLPNTVYSSHLFLPNPQLGPVAIPDLERVFGAPALPAGHPVFAGAWGGPSAQLRELQTVETYLRSRHRYANGTWRGVVGWTAWSWADAPLLVERATGSAVRGGTTVSWRTFEMAAGHNRTTESGELVAGSLRAMPIAASADFDRARPRGSRSRYRVTVSTPRRGDILLVRGHDFTPGTFIEISAGGVTTRVNPSARLPALLMVASLPATVALGAATLTVVRPDGLRSEPVAVTVVAGAPPDSVVLLPGPLKPAPFTIAFVANPRVRRVGGAIVADPILAARARFNAAVASGMQALFAFRESLLHPYANEVRVVARFTPPAPGLAPLCERQLGAMTYPEQANVTAYLAAATVPADVCFAVFRAPAFKRPTAHRTVDGAATAGDQPFTFDAVVAQHPGATTRPGAVAIHAPPTSPMDMLHEFGHAVSSSTNGACTDLYLENANVGFVMNRKRRPSVVSPFPVRFARYDGTDYPTDRPRGAYVGRGGIGYAGWHNYGAELIDRRRPNLMDDYYSTANPRLCLLDELTRLFLRDRIEAKLRR